MKAKNKKELSGVVPVILTPFTKKEEIDEDIFQIGRTGMEPGKGKEF